MERKRGGFSLLELLIVVSLCAVLAVAAYPEYREALRSSRRSDAIASLTRLQLLQERWRAQDVDYASLEELGWGDGESLEGYYRLRLVGRSASGFLAVASPRPDGPQAGDDCGVFALNETGPILAPGYADARCWRR